jgi:hypothetical protein
MKTCRPLLLLTDCSVDRVENEHLGNMDQYRVTREVPLPYTFDDSVRDDDGDDDEEDDNLSKRSWVMRHRSLRIPRKRREDLDDDDESRM